MKLRNVYLALKGQLPLSRMYRNFFVTGNAWGIFSKNSHIVFKTGKPKVIYNTFASAVKAAEVMTEKYDGKFKPYKCVFCDGYHIGKNRI